MTDSQERELVSLAEKLEQRAPGKGAQIAEAQARAGWELSARVRLGEPELVEEAGTKSVALRVLRDQRVALTSTSDLSEAGIERAVDDAMALLELSQPDPAAGPADPSELARGDLADLDLYDDGVASIAADEAIRRATAAEKAALGSDSRIKLSEGATFSRATGTSALVLSGGFTGTQRGSYASLSVAPVVEDEGGKRRRGHYWTGGRHLSLLEADEDVGREAARRTLAKLGARKVPTCEAPVVFDPDVARSLVGTFAGCILGSAIWRKASYLVEREGSEVAGKLVTLIDDPLLPRAPGSHPFDGEGLLARKNVVVDAGVLKTYLLDCYSARKLKRTSTGSAARRGGSPSASTSNFYLVAGNTAAEDIVKQTKRGLYVTEMMGFGFSAVTGDYSRGAAGFWIEDGELAYPVGEITVSSNLDTMLKNVDLVGSDLTFKTSTAAPTLRVASMTIAGT